MIRRLIATLALLGFSVAVSGDDLRFRRLHENWIPGFFTDIRYSGESSTTIWNETFEGAGYAETWSAAETIGTNCILDEDYAVSNISPPVPAGSMGSQSLRSVVAATGTQAYRVHNFGSENAASYSRFHIAPITEALSSGTAITTFIALNSTGTQPIWILQFRDNAGAYEWRALIYHNATPNVFTFAGVRLSHRYRHEFKWDSTADTYEWKVDGVSLASGALTSTAATWGFQFIKVGMDDAAAQGSEMIYDSIAIDTAAYPGIPSEDYVTSSSYVWHELYQFPVSPGTDEIWGDGQLVEGGNTFDGNANPADVGTPSNWVSQSAKVVIGATNPGALIRHQFTPKHPRIFHRGEAVIETDGIADGTFISMDVGKQSHADADPPNDIIAWAVVYQRSGATRFFAIQFGEDPSYFLTGILTDQRYVIEIKYDATDGYFSVWLDGALRVSGVIKTTWATEIGVYVNGSSGGSTGRDSTFYYDQYLMSTAGFPEPIGAKLLLFAPRALRRTQ